MGSKLTPMDEPIPDKGMDSEGLDSDNSKTKLLSLWEQELKPQSLFAGVAALFGDASSSKAVVETQRQKEWRRIPFDRLSWKHNWELAIEFDMFDRFLYGDVSHVAQDLGAFYEEYHNWPAKWGEDIFTTIFSYLEEPKPKKKEEPKPKKKYPR